MHIYRGINVIFDAKNICIGFQWGHLLMQSFAAILKSFGQIYFHKFTYYNGYLIFD